MCIFLFIVCAGIRIIYFEDEFHMLLTTNKVSVLFYAYQLCKTKVAAHDCAKKDCGEFDSCFLFLFLYKQLLVFPLVIGCCLTFAILMCCRIPTEINILTLTVIQTTELALSYVFLFFLLH